ncbi:MAG: hypothetical protein A2Z27_05485 [candidate division Zixibacteria bacterium RBG_16_50_21]|nr:MAG: hypothetical protein A2Z27_05485 [candidate division Zixibacteria bacterium RBG_16_50_21]
MTSWIFAKRAASMETSAIRELLKLTEHADIISFAGGLPAPELFPVEGIRRACQDVLEHYGPKALQYSISSGIHEIRIFLADRLKKRGIEVSEDNFIITGGSQQGLDIIGKAFLDSGAVILCENPTYLGAIQAFSAYRPAYVTVEMDEEGMIIDEVEAKIRRYHPRFIYTVPTFQNPTGRTMSYKRRVQLIELAKKYSIPIVDDNPYSELRYSGEEMPSVKALAGDWVIQLGTFSKIVSPGLRIGWIVAPLDLMPVLEKMKQALDLHTNTFSQYVVWEYCKEGRLEQHIERLKKAYKQRRDVMLEAMDNYMPEEVFWTKPEGGLFLWVHLPQEANSTQLLKYAIENKVAYVPGTGFFPNGGGYNTLRMNFSNANEEKIKTGVKRLAEVFKKHIERPVMVGT